MGALVAAVSELLGRIGAVTLQEGEELVHAYMQDVVSLIALLD